VFYKAKKKNRVPAFKPISGPRFADFYFRDPSDALKVHNALKSVGLTKDKYVGPRVLDGLLERNGGG
jgi:hypothetical protein